jgi:rfaE bifunctional protein nucleotidyltransferase chain/domain
MRELADILTIAKLVQIRVGLREVGRRVGLCHGCFDILHAGHVHHLQQAAGMIDVLVVSVTSANFVGKGPGRPVFDDSARLAVLAALRPVDYVVLNDSPTVAPLIRQLAPDSYFKGADYRSRADNRLADELRALEQVGGRFHLTNDQVFDSSTRAAIAMAPLS